MEEETNTLELSRISHELANPVTLIYSALQRLEKEHPELPTYSHWDGIMDEVRHVRQLLLDVRLFQSSSQLHLTTFSYGDFAQEISHSFYPYLQEKNQTLLLQCPSRLPLINADRRQLKQVLENLIKNASEASCTNAMIGWRIYRDSHHLINEIIDSGSGIAPETEALLFQPFQTTKPCGTGLGLPISRQIIENHHGTLTYRRNPTGGTIFSFSLPIP
jgi:two-component system sensor histidine kinase AtoS